MTANQEQPADPYRVLKAFGALRTLIGMYPSGHPLVAEKIREVYEGVRAFAAADWIRLDVIHGVAYVNGQAFEGAGNAPGLGFESLHVHAEVQPDEIAAAADVLRRVKPDQASPSMGEQLAERGVHHISVGRLVPLDTRWSARQWPDAPDHVFDPDYEESLVLAKQAFEDLSKGRTLDLRAVRDLVSVLVGRVVTSNTALAQILAVKRFENLTYIHSVNVAVLSLLLGRKVGLTDDQLTVLVEAAVLHDVGKTRIPLDLVKKPGALDKRERKIMEAHPVLGAEMLTQMDGLHPLTPVVALEHHRTAAGGGYPDLGHGVVPHLLSQIVSVADVYEAVTGARSYQTALPPERACLLLARLAGEKLRTAFVKAFVSAITFFPVGSVVRTNRGELAVVIRPNAADPLHPVIQLVTTALQPTAGPVDTSARDHAGAYERHVVETVEAPDDGAGVARLLAA